MQIRIPSLKTSDFVLRLLVLVYLLACVSLVVQAADTPKSVFVVGSCLDKTSSNVLSSLKDEIRTSQKYRLARNLGDGDQMGIVLTINVSCTERKDVTAIATVFGAAKCFNDTNCHHAIAGTSVRAELCDANSTAECGRAIFRAFDDYVVNPIKPRLTLD